jgi:hypothetical protein
MPLILAIEPDHRQAAQIASIARDRVDAELVLADTTEGALDIIGDRIPDLVLVPALLSPQDDAALAAALRVIAAAAHVRTLTIPVFATAAPAPATRGVLDRWRRAKRAPAPDGCDPAVFAEQICAYLEERAACADLLPPPVPTERPVQPIEIAPPLVVAPPLAVEPPVDDRRVVEEVPIVKDEPQADAAASQDEVEDAVEIDISPELDSEGSSFAMGEPAFDLVMTQEPTAAMELTTVIEANEPPVLSGVEGPVPSHVEGPVWDEPIAVDEPMDVDDPITVDEPIVPEDIPAFPPPRPFEPWVPMSCGVERLWPRIEGMLVEEDRPERTEWTALIASLRQDMERRRDTPEPEPVARKTNRRHSKPVQDEWGFFDPEQCGFAALLAKLDEITGSQSV